MAKRVEKLVTVAGVNFVGATVAEAKANGEQRIAKFVAEATRGPSVFRVGDSTVVIWPDVESWAYRVIRPDDTGGTGRAMCNQGGSRADCIASAVGHAAMWQWSADDEGDSASLRDHNYLCGLFGPAYRAADVETREALDHAQAGCRDQMAWQRRYKAAQKACGSDDRAHGIACRTASVKDATTAALAA